MSEGGIRSCAVSEGSDRGESGHGPLPPTVRLPLLSTGSGKGQTLGVPIAVREHAL